MSHAKSRRDSRRRPPLSSIALAWACVACLAGLTACTSAVSPVVEVGDFMGGSFDVTIENLSSGQPLSPGVIVTHSTTQGVWRTGAGLTEGLIDIAEDGEPTAAVQELEGAQHVYQVLPIPAPTHRIGGPGPSSQTIRIDATPTRDRLSVLMMLICTNDAITGVDSLPLPQGNDPLTVYTIAYDAGSEQNTEEYGDIPDPCQAIGPVASPGDGNRDDAVPDDGRVVHAHPGLSGAGDLDPAVHGWPSPVARITVQRVP